MAAVDFASKRFEHFPAQESSFFHPVDKADDKGGEHFVSTVPAFDIWKKFEFEFIPTPPLSPSRSEPDYSSPFDEQDLEAVADTLEMLTEVANDSCQATAALVAMSESGISTRSLKSKLIQDCMWNGASYELSGDFGSPSVVEACYETPCSTPPPVEYVSSDCVDPSAVFPYPINDTQIGCGSQQSSDSEEEIDVVTIEKPKKRSQPNGNDQMPTVPTKRMRSAAVKAKPASPPPVAIKIVRRQASTTSSNSGSDEEDYDKRATHNVLERKRRNDLKTSFHSLRDEVPDIKENERAPKVLILKKAKEHIEKLVSDELNLLTELEKERNRNQRLQEKFFLLGQKRK